MWIIMCLATFWCHRSFASLSSDTPRTGVSDPPVLPRWVGQLSSKPNSGGYDIILQSYPQTAPLLFCTLMIWFKCWSRFIAVTEIRFYSWISYSLVRSTRFPKLPKVTIPWACSTFLRNSEMKWLMAESFKCFWQTDLEPAVNICSLFTELASNRFVRRGVLLLLILNDNKLCPSIWWMIINFAPRSDEWS